MSRTEETKRVASGPEVERTAKRPYHKPAIRYERVFETSALSCGKIQSTQSQCAHNRKTS